MLQNHKLFMLKDTEPVSQVICLPSSILLFFFMMLIYSHFLISDTNQRKTQEKSLTQMHLKIKKRRALLFEEPLFF